MIFTGSSQSFLQEAGNLCLLFLSSSVNVVMSKYSIGDKVRFRGSGIVVKVPGGIGPKYVGADLCISSSALCTITGTVNMCGSEVAYFVDVAVCDLLTINVRVREEELVRVEECEGGSVGACVQ